jgi:methionyl-tRNA formyltransferase
MLTPPVDDAPPAAEGAAPAAGCWVETAWAHLVAKPEFSLRPQPWTLPLAGPGPAGPSGVPARIVVLGMSSDYGNGLLLHLLRLGCVPVGLVTSTRLHTLSEETLFAHAAAALGIPYLAVGDINTTAAIDALRALKPDALFVFSFDQIFAAPVLAVPRVGAVNFHPSLLPRFRGAEPLFWQVFFGEREAGLTAHLITERIDAGPIVGQVRVPVEPTDTAGRLARRTVLAAGPLLDQVVRAVAAGHLAGELPDLQHGSYQRGLPSMALDWQRPAAELERFVRAGRPDAPAFVTWQGERYDILDASTTPHEGPPGMVIAVTPQGPIVGTGEQALLLRRVVGPACDGRGPRGLRVQVGDVLLGGDAAGTPVPGGSCR